MEAKINEQEEKMLTNILEIRAETENGKVLPCLLKSAAMQIEDHPDRKMLEPLWKGCYECPEDSPDTNCPGYREDNNVLERQMSLIPDKALIKLNDTTCTFMLSFMHLSATDPSYQPSKQRVEITNCPDCDGHKKASCYMPRTHGLEIISTLKDLYAERISGLKK
jgi:hypothetical protein